MTTCVFGEGFASAAYRLFELDEAVLHDLLKDNGRYVLSPRPRAPFAGPFRRMRKRKEVLTLTRSSLSSLRSTAQREHQGRGQ